MNQPIIAELRDVEGQLTDLAYEAEWKGLNIKDVVRRLNELRAGVTARLDILVEEDAKILEDIQRRRITR